MSNTIDFTDETQLATLSEDALFDEHFETMHAITHFVREKLHAEFHLKELDEKLFFLDQEIEKRNDKPKLSLVEECPQKD